jgi:hypothetical protein
MKRMQPKFFEANQRNMAAYVLLKGEWKHHRREPHAATASHIPHYLHDHGHGFAPGWLLALAPLLAPFVSEHTRGQVSVRARVADMSLRSHVGAHGSLDDIKPTEKCAPFQNTLVGKHIQRC